MNSTAMSRLMAVNSTSDAELLSAAQSLLKLIRALSQGEKHIQVAQGTGIAQADYDQPLATCSAAYWDCEVWERRGG